MQIHGPSQVHGAQNINAPHFSPRTTSAQGPSSTQGADRVDFSAAALEALNATETAGIRTDLVNTIRQQIAAGTYDTPDKMDVAMNRLFDQLG
jgi:negative regulator of flagellin synthesis FlgM